MPEPVKMKCVFCFQELKKTDICFATVNSRVDLTPDPIKLAFLRKTDPGVQAEDVQAMSRQPIQRYKEGAPGFDLDEDTGLPVAWREPLDESGNTLRTTQRVCAHCHMPLPGQLGKRKNIIIGFSGNSSSGKTVYILSLIHDLARKVTHLSVTPDPVFYTRIKTNYKTMYENMYLGSRVEEIKGRYHLPTATDTLEKLSPLVLNCAYKDREFMLTLFDMAGEGSKDPEYIAKNAAFLGEADGVIYLKNPEYFPGMEKSDESFDEHAYLNDIFENINRHARIAITMTKADLLADRYEHDASYAQIMKNAFEDEEVSVHAHGFVPAAAYRMDSQMRKLYQWDNCSDSVVLNVRRRAEKIASFEAPRRRKGLFGGLFGGRREEDEFAYEVEEEVAENIMLFGASAFGRNVKKYHIDNPDYSRIDFITQIPNGIRNVDPILWILHCNGLLPPRSGDRN